MIQVFSNISIRFHPDIQHYFSDNQAWRVMALNGMGEIYTVVKQQIYCGRRGSGCVDSVPCALWSLKCPTFSKTVRIALGNSSTSSSRCSRTVLQRGISKESTFSATFPLFNLFLMNQLKAFMMCYVPLSAPPYSSCLWTLDWLLCKDQTRKEALQHLAPSFILLVTAVT